MTAKEYVLKNVKIATVLTEDEYKEIAALHLMARDFEIGVSAFVTLEAKQMGVETYWRGE